VGYNHLNSASVCTLVDTVYVPTTYPFQDDFVKQFDPQQIAWALMLLPYRTTNGGIRNKLLFATWVPDTLSRATFKETIRLKSSAVFFSAGLKKAAARDGAKMYQANDPSDLKVHAVLDTVAKFERDPIDVASVDRLTTTAV
jgi:hypothetical protein